MMRWLDDRYFK